MYYKMNLSVSFHCIPPCEVCLFLSLLFPRENWRLERLRNLHGQLTSEWKDCTLDPGPSDSVAGPSNHCPKLLLWRVRSQSLGAIERKEGAVFLLLRVCVSVCLLFLCVHLVQLLPCAKWSWAVTIITSFSDSFWKILFQSFISVCGCGWS